ncbi:MAG: hypothetical protein Kow00121_26750 [Elainellaceae cyanobacterium]
MTVLTHSEFYRPRWRTIVVGALAFWLSSSLLLDFVIMPTMYAAGMTTEPGFAAAGYSLFWIFNRVELLCAAFALTGVLVLKTLDASSLHRWAVPISATLLAIALIYTYGLTPEMSSLGLQLNWFEPRSEAPALMNQMHGSYWALELLKLTAAGLLLRSYITQAKFAD